MMLGHYALTLYRSFARHKLYAAINVLGLAVGIAVFLVLMLDVKFQTSFERWIPNSSQIYAVRQTWNRPGHPSGGVPYTMGGLLEELRADFPGEVEGARAWTRSGAITQRGLQTTERISIVDPAFFSVFRLNFLRGSAADALSSPDSVVLSESRARSYFPSLPSAIGQTITVAISGQTRSYTVTGILNDAPRSTDFSFDVLVPLTAPMMSSAEQPRWYHWGSSQVETFLRFPDQSHVQSFNAKMDSFVDRRAQKDLNSPAAHKAITLRAIPVTSIHLADPKDRGALALLGVVGSLTLLLASVNYVNLASARSVLRAREVALRKVMGVTPRGLAFQFLFESLATSLAAAVIGLALSTLALPIVNAAGGLVLRLDLLGSESVLPLVIAAVLLVGLGAGAYPALLLSRFRPSSVLASARAPGGGRAGSRVRSILVGAQFTIAIGFGVCTSIILAQGDYLHHADLGFRRQGLIVVKSFGGSAVTAAQRSTLMNLWRTVPEVAGIASADIGPGVDDSTSATNVRRAGVSDDGPSLNYVTIGPDFFSVYNARLLAGRTLSGEYGMDIVPHSMDTEGQSGDASTRSTVQNIVLNKTAAIAEGFRSPEEAVGKTLFRSLKDGGVSPMRVVGVVEDLRFRSPRTAVPGTFYMASVGDIKNSVATIRFTGDNAEAVVDRLRTSWRQLVPNLPFRAETGERSLGTYYKQDDDNGRLFTVGALLAVGIGCMGLYGLAAFSTARRVKEIGIRKTLGASTRDILTLLLWQFLRPVLWANVVAWPLAWLAMRIWLSGFDQRIELGPKYFMVASVVALALAVTTVAGQAWRVARAEPARALRYE